MAAGTRNDTHVLSLSLTTLNKMSSPPKDTALMVQQEFPTPISPISSTEKRSDNEDTVDGVHQSRDIESAAVLDDSVLLGQRSWAESIVLSFANLIPPLGVA